MNEINTKWNLGNFAVSLTTKVDDTMRHQLATFGLRFLGQRVSAVDKILGGFETGADGKSKRKAGWKRTDAAFGAALAGKLATAFAELDLPESEAKLAASATFTEYVPTAGAPKFVEEKAACVKHESAGDLEEWLKTKVGFAGETHGADCEYSTEMLMAVKAFKIAFLKGM